MRHQNAPEPKEFPQPHMYATWMQWRSPQFKTHSSPSHVKTAIGGKARGGKITCDTYIYQWDENAAEWIELDFLPRDSLKVDSAFFQATHKRALRKAKPPSEKAVAEALASINESLREG